MNSSTGNVRVRLLKNPIAIFMVGMVIAGSGIVGTREAQAAIVQWTLSSVTFEDGGIATGFFDFEAATSTISDWTIDVSGGDVATFPAFTYSPTNTVAFFFGGINGAQFFVDPFAPGGTPDSRVIVLVPLAPLTDLGGTVPLDTTSGGFQSRECFDCNPFRNIVTGSVVGGPPPTGAPIPEPGTLLLIASGLAGFGITTRRRNHKDR